MPRPPMNPRSSRPYRMRRAAPAMRRQPRRNSAGIFLGARYHFDLVRPGVALYGGKRIASRPIQCGRSSASRRASSRSQACAPADASATAHARALTPTRIATVAAGYADGCLPPLGSTRCGRRRGRYRRADSPILGRVSMDLIMVDVTDARDPAPSAATWWTRSRRDLPVEDVGASARRDDRL